MNRDQIWESLKDAIRDQIPSVRPWVHIMQPNMELYEISIRPIDWAVIVGRLLPEGITLTKFQEDEVFQRTATLHGIMDYVEQANDKAIERANNA